MDNNSSTNDSSIDNKSAIVDIINEYGVKSVSLKTNISIDSLNRLSQNDYSKFTKIQTLGFVKIIEREYNIKLPELKNNIREFFVKNDNIKQEHFITTDVDSNVESGGFSSFIFYIFIISTIYGLWYIYENYYKTTLTQDIIVPQKTYFNIENNYSKIEEKKPVVDIKPIEIKKVVEKNETVDNSKNKVAILDILNTLDSDKNSTLDVNDRTKDYNKTTDNIVEEEKKVALRSNIELIPSSKIWFGFINITNPKKRWHKSYKRATSYSFDVEKDSWLMMINRGKFTIKDNNNTKEYDIKSRTYFKINSQDGIEEITYNEYKSLGGYRVW
ncbi:membrane protein [hydrothermal vent metagenome]|uniref:Membrane protein n=1 Tax=hydrothermal vent metagenome TaxID=652676 RepID=A0A1W1EJ02_9ZZZZ